MPDTSQYIPITLPTEGDFICEFCGLTITRSEPAVIKTDGPGARPEHKRGVFMHRRCTTPLFVPKGKCCGTCHWMPNGFPDKERRGVMNGFCDAPVPLSVSSEHPVRSDQGIDCPCWTDVPLPFKTLDKLASAFNTLFCFVSQATAEGQNMDEERAKVVQAITETFDKKGT